MYYLNERDRDLVKIAIEHAIKVLQNNKSKELPDFDELIPASDTYIVRIPVSGIPALQEVGTSEIDAPGSRECTVYQIIDGELISAGFAITCLNLSSTALSTGWAKATKDKFGSWIIDKIIEGAGTGTGTTPCPTLWDNITLDDLPEIAVPTYVLSIESDAFGYCVGKTPVVDCDTGTGS